jgi:hypothetical protein
LFLRWMVPRARHGAVQPGIQESGLAAHQRGTLAPSGDERL